MTHEPLDQAVGAALDPPEWPERPRLPGPPDPAPLPLDALPPGVRNEVESVAGSLQVPSDMAAVLALGTLSASVCGKVEVSVRSGWREVLNLYAAAILPPASRKSPAFEALTAPIRSWEAEEIWRMAPRHAAALDLLEVMEKTLERVKRDVVSGSAELSEVEAARLKVEEARGKVPPDGRLLAGDITVEALVMRMALQGGRVALLEPEPGPLHVLAGRYSDSTPRLEELKKAWGGEPILVDRVGRAPLRVDRPSLALVVCLQPGVLEGLQNGKAFRTEGALARFLWVQPPHGLGSRLTGLAVPPRDRMAQEVFSRIVRALLEAEAQDSPLSLEPGALELLHGFEAEVEADLGDGGRFEGIRDWAGKMVGHSVRAAALLELAARAGDGRPLFGSPIGPWAMDGGIRLLQALATHALKVLGEAGMDERTALLTYVLGRAKTLPEGSSLRDLFEACRGKTGIDDMADLAPLVAKLEDRGCLRLVSLPPREGPGRPPSPTVELHPDTVKSIRTIRTNTPGRGTVVNSADSVGQIHGSTEKSEEWTEALANV